MVDDENIYRVRDAIADLQELDPDLPLVLSSDEEGNNVRMVNSIGTQLVRELEHQHMDTVCQEDLDEYDSTEEYKEDHGLSEKWQPIKVAEVW